MECAESLRVQAFFDGEADALTALEIERHVETCDACRTLLRGLGQVRRLIRGEGLVRTPEVLRERLLRELDRESAARPAHRRRRDAPLWASGPFWIGLLSGTGGGAVAAALVALFVMVSGKPLLDDLIADHTRSLLSSHLIDVVSTDQHTVKPWFAGRTDVSPVVADFAAQGYRLIGGRADYLDHQRAAVVVYQHGAHVINVFSWALRSSGSVPRDTNRNGYHLAFWKVGNVGYCAVSDAGWSELRSLVQLLQAAGARDTPE